MGDVSKLIETYVKSQRALVKLKSEYDSEKRDYIHRSKTAKDVILAFMCSSDLTAFPFAWDTECMYFRVKNKKSTLKVNCENVLNYVVCSRAEGCTIEEYVGNLSGATTSVLDVTSSRPRAEYADECPPMLKDLCHDYLYCKNKLSEISQSYKSSMKVYSDTISSVTPQIVQYIKGKDPTYRMQRMQMANDNSHNPVTTALESCPNQ